MQIHVARSASTVSGVSGPVPQQHPVAIYPLAAAGPLHALLYTSVVAAACSPAAIQGIIDVARVNNQRAGIGGWLLFDGTRFCQYLEGDPAAIEGLAGRIGRDVRHTGMAVLEQVAVGLRRFPRGWLGYAVVPPNGALGRIACHRGPAAVHAMAAFVATLATARAQAARRDRLAHQNPTIR
jgi:hypothetical protein